MLEEPEKEEVKVAGDQETVWKAMKGLEASGKYRCHFDIKDTITVMWNKAENKLHRLRTQEKKRTKWYNGWLTFNSQRGKYHPSNYMPSVADGKQCSMMSLHF